MDINYLIESLFIFNPIEALSIILSVCIIHKKNINWRIVPHSYFLGTLFLLVQILPAIFSSYELLCVIFMLLSLPMTMMIIYLYFGEIIDIKLKISTIVIIISSMALSTIMVVIFFSLININVYELINVNFWYTLFIILMIKILTIIIILINNKIKRFIDEKFFN